jgi:glycosyltransferase involved in cell wall biosynthesis
MDSFLPKTEIYHSLHVQIPPSSRLKRILTVHDCRFLAFPDLYPPQAVEDYRRIMNTSLERADMVATVSKSTRQELLTHFKISGDQIKVIHNGFRPYVPTAIDCRKKLRRFMQKHNFPKDYLLFVGVLDPRKNLGRLIEALSILKEEVSDIPDLVIAGISPRQWSKSDEAKEAARLGILKYIHVIGVVERDILFCVMQRSSALCYPSLYEGFGFPTLEAMSQGIPVLAGKSSSIPEVTGDAACLVDPMSVNDIARGLHKIIFDSEYRQKLVEHGFNQIKKFSWRRAAGEYIRLYKQVLAS